MDSPQRSPPSSTSDDPVQRTPQAHEIPVPISYFPNGSTQPPSNRAVVSPTEAFIPRQLWSGNSPTDSNFQQRYCVSPPTGYDYNPPTGFGYSPPSRGSSNTVQVMRGELNTLQLESQNVEIQLQAEVQDLRGRITGFRDENSSLRDSEVRSHNARNSINATNARDR